jgi:acylphosphatase
MARKRIRAVVTGRVQGVFFRAHTAEKGRNLNLSGWVRNLADGSVETVAQGEAESLLAFSQWLHHGPPAASVTSVEIQEEPPGQEFPGFIIRYD